MARAPFQVLVIPYLQNGANSKFAVLKGSDGVTRQFIAGGGEDAEDPYQAAKREAFEEAAIQAGTWVALDSKASIPRKHFPKARHWGPEIFVITEHAFGVKVGGPDLILSREHSECEWLTKEEADAVLTYDSNRVALWELCERLKTPGMTHP